MEFSPYIAFTAEDQPINGATVHVITCLTATLAQDEMPAGKDLIVYSDDLTISTALSIPGQNLTIIARTVTLGDGASVNLSGADGVNSWQGKARNGDPGASAQAPDATDGDAGTKGADGQNAGNFTLVAGTITGTMPVTCRGGVGAKGQDGGDGGTGLRGADGANFQTQEVSGPPNMVNTLVHDGLPGMNGGRAGAGGEGGQGGAGGNGGIVTIGYMVGPAPIVTSTCLGGAGGTGGAGGAAGKAGDGGTGGYTAKQVQWGGKGGSGDVWDNTYQHAASGYEGAPASKPVGDVGEKGHDGNPGSTSPVIVPAPDFYSAYSPSTEWELLALRQAEFLYLNGESPNADYSDAAQRLLWLSQITKPPVGVNPSADNDRAQVLARANALLAQIALRLNFYCQPYSHVELASLNYYQNTLPGILAAGTVIETSYNNYVKEGAKEDDQRAELSVMLSNSAKQLDLLRKSKSPLNDQITTYQSSVKDLKLARNLQGVVLQTSEARWETAVISKLKSDADTAQCKKYMDIFTTIASIVTIKDPQDFSSMTTKFKADHLGKAMTISGDISSWEDAVTRLDTAKGDLDSIVSAANDLAKDAALGDSSKIAVDRAIFEAKLLPYKKLDSTGKLEAQINLYLAKAQAFSQKQLDYNALQVQLLNLVAKITQAQTEHDNIKNKLSDTVNPQLAIYKAFMARTYGETLDTLIRDVYGLSQAYRYWALADYTLPPGHGNWTMAYLSFVQGELSQKVTDQLNGYGTGPATFTQDFDYRSADGAGWKINDPQQLDAFKVGTKVGNTDIVHRLNFTIALHDNPWADDNFAGFAQVVATDYSVEIHGATLTSGQLFVRLIHSGQAPFIDPAGKDWLFSHVPVSTSFKYDLAHGNRVAGGALSGTDINVHIGLSPFTTWTLQVHTSDNPGLDLTNVDQIVLKFAGRYRERNACLPTSASHA